MCIQVIIGHLIPYEIAAVCSRVEKAGVRITAGIPDPAKVVEINGEYLVVDGTNRIVAALGLGMTEYPCAIVSNSSKAYQDTLKWRKVYGPTFETIKTVNSDRIRDDMSEKEIDAMLKDEDGVLKKPT